MNTQEFLEAIVPAGSNVAIAMLRPDGTMGQKFFPTHAEAAAFVAKAIPANIPVYHGCAGYGPESGGRKAENVTAIGALWLDIDVGPSKPYQNKNDAFIALANFVTTLGMPKPLVVDSGYGLHVYWPLARAVTRAEWLPVARALKSAAVALGLGADPTRTADAASVLRPVGTFNRKDPANPKPVRFAAGYDAHYLLTHYHTILGVEPDPLGDMPAHIQRNTTMNADFSAGTTGSGDAAQLDDVLAVCGQLRAMRDAPESQSYPEWYSCLGVLAFCEGGEDIAHEWSAGHPGYRRAQTQKFLDKWQTLTGGATCAKFKSDNPAGCAGCTFTGKSPLGAPRKQIVVHTLADGTTISQAVRKSVGDPAGYGTSDQGISRTYKDDSGAWANELICTRLFRPIAAINTSTQQGIGVAHHVEFEVIYQKAGGVTQRNTFTIPGDTLAKQQGFLEAIGKHLIYPAPNKERFVHEYAKAYVMKLHSEKDDIKSVDHFGWHDDDFVVGRTVYKADGTNEEAVLMGSAVSLGGNLGPMTNDAHAWVDAVDKVMQLPGNEAMQFALLCSLAAPIWAFSHDVPGVMVHYYSPDSGRGKTTAQRIGLSVWGRQDRMMLTGNGATPNAFVATVSTYSNLPVAYDELTISKTFTPMDLLYRVSQGNEKTRMTSNAVLREVTASWRTIVMSTANNSMSSQIKGEMANTTGGRARLFEVRIGERAEVPDALRVFNTIYENGGTMVPIYAPYLVANRKQLTDEVFATREALTDKLNFSSDERMWHHLFASVLVTYKHVKKLGMIRFNSDRLLVWMVARLAENRKDLRAQKADYLDVFADFMNSIAQSWLVTTGIGNAVKADGREDTHVIKDPSRELLVRVVYPEKPGDPAYFEVAQKTIEAWGRKAGVDITELKALLISKSLFNRSRKDRLGRGVRKWSSGLPTTNWEIDLSAIVDARSLGRLNLISGGKI